MHIVQFYIIIRSFRILKHCVRRTIGYHHLMPRCEILTDILFWNKVWHLGILSEASSEGIWQSSDAQKIQAIGWKEHLSSFYKRTNLSNWPFFKSFFERQRKKNVEQLLFFPNMNQPSYMKVVFWSMYVSCMNEGLQFQEKMYLSDAGLVTHTFIYFFREKISRL